MVFKQQQYPRVNILNLDKLERIVNWCSGRLLAKQEVLVILPIHTVLQDETVALARSLSTVDQFIRLLAEVVQLMIQGRIPDKIQPWLLGALLLALRKPLEK